MEILRNFTCSKGQQPQFPLSSFSKDALSVFPHDGNKTPLARHANIVSNMKLSYCTILLLLAVTRKLANEDDGTTLARSCSVFLLIDRSVHGVLP